MNRRQFVTVTAVGAGSALLAQGPRLGERTLLGKLRSEDGAAPVAGAKWYVAEAAGDGIELRFSKGALAEAKCLTSDMFLDGRELAVFAIQLREGENGRAFRFSYGALNQCSFRVRVDLGLVDQGRWMVDREGAFLKPICGGDRVDLRQVDRLTLTVSRKGPSPARWCMTDLRAVAEMPPRITKPVLPKGPLLDEFGQSAILDWPGKTRSVEELTNRIRGQYENATKQSWPEDFSRWGGWKTKRLGEGTGWFVRTTTAAAGGWSIRKATPSLEIGHLRRKVGASDFAGLFLPDVLPYFWRLLNHAATAGERNIWKRPFRSAGVCSPPAN